VMESAATAQLDKQRRLKSSPNLKLCPEMLLKSHVMCFKLVVCLRFSLFIKTQVFLLRFCLFRLSFISLRQSFERWSNSQTKDDVSFGRKMVLKAGVDIGASLGDWAT
jgi:hypothetical protein